MNKFEKLTDEEVHKMMIDGDEEAFHEFVRRAEERFMALPEEERRRIAIGKFIQKPEHMEWEK